MRKKVVIFCTILAAGLLAVIGYVYYNLFDHSRTEMIADVTHTDALQAIPSDAVLLLEMKSLSDAAHLFPGAASDYSSFLSFLPERSSKWETAFSLHYTGKNKVSLLLVIRVPESQGAEELKSLISGKCTAISEKKYEGRTIYKSSVPGISYTIYNNYLIASTSSIIVESSVRHLESRTSILDDPGFIAVSKLGGGSKPLFFVNNRNIGKFFSGTVNSDFLRYSSFVSGIADWTLFEIDGNKEKVAGNGKFSGAKDDIYFSHFLSKLKSSPSKVGEVLPYNTGYVVTIPISDTLAYYQGYDSYLQANRRIDKYQELRKSISPRKWLSELGIKELAKAAVPTESGLETILLMRVKNPDAMKNDYKGYISSIFGLFFTPSSEEAYCVVGDWVVVGSGKFLADFRSAVVNRFYFSLSDYLSQTPAKEALSGNTSLTVVVNMSGCMDSLSAIFKKEYSDRLIGRMSDKNFNFFTSRIINDGEKSKMDFCIYEDNLAVEPRPLSSPSADVIQAPSDDKTPIVVPTGPFEVKDFRTGKKNYLAQSSNKSLRLLDDKKKGVWNVLFSDPICGYVGQIDYLKNGKLQMVFAAGSKLYLMDRLGRWVAPYPVDTKREIVLGPKIYDFNKNKEYSLMVLHKDNKVAMYDRDGKPVSTWNEITAPEKIISLPELLDMGGKRYWVVRTSFQTLIYGKEGMLVADFTKKRRLKPDTEIKKISPSEVSLVTIEDKEAILDLETGSFTK